MRDLKGVENDLEAFQKYLELKAKVNIEPNISLDGQDEKIICHLLRDFLRDLDVPFIAKWPRVIEGTFNLISLSRFQNVSKLTNINCSEMGTNIRFGF